ncbi:MAG: flagellar hook-associated protein 2 [Thermacetogenium sp.]|nr:flagellar hook-associated protein 2 [Thermacetogenium sp.]
MAGINRVSGLASGMDIDQIVSDLMKAQRMRLDRVIQDRQIWQWKQEDYRSLNASLLSLRNVVSNLRLQGSFLAKKATSSDEGIVTAAAGTSAAPAIYQVKVNSLATTATSISTDPITTDSSFDPMQSLVSQKDKFTDVPPDFEWSKITFTINNKEFSFDGNTASLNSIIEAVNADQDAGVTMFYDANTKRIVVTADRTGDYNGLDKEIKVEGDFLTTILKLESADGTDASFEINGLAITSHTNSYTVNGVTFNFRGADPGRTVTVSVAHDVDAVVNTVKSFVNKYNEVLEAINKKLYEERHPDYRPLTEEQIKEGKLTDRQIDAWQDKARSGLLKGDPLLSGIVADMRSVLSGIVEGVTGQVTVSSGGRVYTTTADRLSVIGITTGAWNEKGKLYLDESRLREALQSNPDAVMELFTRTRDADGREITDDEQKGLAVRLYDAINGAISRLTGQAGTAESLYDNSYISRRIRDINENIAVMEERLQKLEDRYYRQFTALEQAIAAMNVQSMWLTQQFFVSGQ